MKAKLEPYLGFLHSTQYSKPSLVCDVQELYRHLIDDFLVKYCQSLRVKDFIVKTEDLTRSKTGKRVYLNDAQTRDLMNQLNQFFESYVEIPRIKVGKQQAIATLINEKALLFAKHLRNEQMTWIPRIAIGSMSPMLLRRTSEDDERRTNEAYPKVIRRVCEALERKLKFYIP